MNSWTTLNKEQQEAVEKTEGPVVIIAGPGTGKTKTMTARIDYLVAEKGVEPRKILALTFTKKAAEEIKNRLSTQQVWVGTFHALGFELLSENKSDWKIVDVLTQRKIIKQLVNKKVDETMSDISRYKSGLVVDEKIKLVAKIYDEELEKMGLKDYDDLLEQSIERLKQNKQLQQRYQDKFDYILVDEFQDTNLVQYELLKLLVNKNNNLCVIGDPKQSIYAFRGANTRVFEQLVNDFPTAAIIELKINYRNPSNIITLSKALFSDCPELVADNKINAEIKLIESENEFSLSRWTADFIEQSCGGLDLTTAGSQNGSLGETAILYRNHRLARNLIKELTKRGIPFLAAGEESNFIKDPIKTIVEQLVNLPETATFEEMEKLLPKGIDSDFKQMVEQFSQTAKPVVAFKLFWEELAKNNFVYPGADRVHLLTIHSAKGLEFKNVIILGFEEGIIPHPKSELEEEKRLLYVAVTRAKNNLYLLRAKRREKKPTKISPFFETIKNLLTMETDVVGQKQWQRYRLKKLKKSQMGLF